MPRRWSLPHSLHRPSPVQAGQRGFAILFAPFLLMLIPVLVLMCQGLIEAHRVALLPRTYGTGLIVSEAGHVLTSAQVVEGCVGDYRFHTEARGYLLSLVAVDETRNLALLKMKGDSGAAPFPLQTGGLPQEGDPVVIFSYPTAILGFYETTPPLMTLSHMLGRQPEEETTQDKELRIQAMLWAGSSGGPVLDRYGQLIGIAREEADFNLLAAHHNHRPDMHSITGTQEIADFLEAQGIFRAQLPKDHPPREPALLRSEATARVGRLHCARNGGIQ